MTELQFWFLSRETCRDDCMKHPARFHSQGSKIACLVKDLKGWLCYGKMHKNASQRDRNDKLKYCRRNDKLSFRCASCLQIIGCISTEWGKLHFCKNDDQEWWENQTFLKDIFKVMVNKPPGSGIWVGVFMLSKKPFFVLFCFVLCFLGEGRSNLIPFSLFNIFLQLIWKLKCFAEQSHPLMGQHESQLQLFLSIV